ncbi:hypothetical protein KY289_002533 [Solanum tuberosum]|nr:hypothetical protein KY289_002533 [Solanum tuberosum]
MANYTTVCLLFSTKDCYSMSLLTPDEGLLELRVADIIDWDTRTWNTHKLETLFSIDEIDCIKKGRYTVKSGYSELHNATTLIPNGQFWWKIWKLKMPPKVLNFVWRALIGVLPTGDNLMNKKILNPAYVRHASKRQKQYCTV